MQEGMASLVRSISCSGALSAESVAWADWTPVGDLPLQHTLGPLTISLVGARPLKLWS
jgi:hypothetical protein